LISRLYLAVLFGCFFAALASGQNDDWPHYVRIAGHGLNTGSVPAIISESQKSNVFGIEVDNDIPGRYESFLDPTEKLKAIRTAAEAAHQVGNKAFVYIAGLECITANADRAAHSFFRDHPAWVQRQINGKPAMFGEAPRSGSVLVMKMSGSRLFHRSGARAIWTWSGRSPQRESMVST
jgi:hypothetical protein